MGTLKVRYPFANNVQYLLNGTFSDVITYNNAILSYFVGVNNIFGKYGTVSLYRANDNTLGLRGLDFTPSFATGRSFEYHIPSKNLSNTVLNKPYFQVWRPGSSTGQNILYHDDTIQTRDYTTIPFYSYETSSTYMFAFDSLNNFFMITERISIDDPTVKSCALMSRKTYGATDMYPLGFYEWNDSADLERDAYYANLYTDTSLYNVSNIGYCSTCVLYQYVRDGFIYPDIYYCDGGMAVPPDGIVRIGASNFMRLGSNLFLRIDWGDELC